MFPFGLYDGYGLGYGLGYGMMPSVIPSPPALNYQGDTNAYVSHHTEGGIDSTTALLSFAALSALGGLLIAHKLNKTNKIVDAVTHKLASEAKIKAGNIVNEATTGAEATKLEADAYAHNTRSAADAVRKTAEETASARLAEVEEAHANFRAEFGDAQDSLTQQRVNLEQREAEAAEREADLAQRAKSTTNPVSTKTQPGHTEPVSQRAVVVVGKGDKKVAKAAKIALKGAGADSTAAAKLYNEGEYNKALPLFEESIKGYEVAKQAGKLEEAHIPYYANALHDAGACHQLQGNFGAAIGYYDRALNVIPDDIPTLLNKARCHNQLGEQGKFVECLESAASAGDETSMIEVAIIKSNQKSYTEAAKWYEKAVAKNHPDGCFGLAFLYEKGLGVDKDYLKALRLYKQSLEQYLPLANGNPAVIKRLEFLNDKLRLNNPTHWFICNKDLSVATATLNDQEKAIRDFITDDKLTQLLAESKSIVEGTTTSADKAAKAATATPQGDTRIKPSYEPPKSPIAANSTGEVAPNAQKPKGDLTDPNGPATLLDEPKTLLRGPVRDAKVVMGTGPAIDPKAARQPLAPAGDEPVTLRPEESVRTEQPAQQVAKASQPETPSVDPHQTVVLSSRDQQALAEKSTRITEQTGPGTNATLAGVSPEDIKASRRTAPGSVNDTLVEGNSLAQRENNLDRAQSYLRKLPKA